MSLSLCIAGSLATISAAALAEPADLSKLESRVRAIEVTRLGTAAAGGKRAAFPKPGAADVEFAPRLREDSDPRAGYLALARTRSGLALWNKRHWDDGSDSQYLFEARASDGSELPAGAVLQFVDGLEVPARPSDIGDPGRWIGKMGDQTTELLVEAWLALPADRVIYRATERKLYPLVPARGPYRPEQAKKLQWMLFVPACEETRSACVYFGRPRDLCARYNKHSRERDAWIWPQECG